MARVVGGGWASVQRLLGRARAVRFPLAAPSWPATVERPDPERKLGLDYDHEWSRRYPVRLARAMVMDNVARPVARLWPRPPCGAWSTCATSRARSSSPPTTPATSTRRCC